MPIVATNEPAPVQAGIAPNLNSESFTAFLGRAVQKFASNNDIAARTTQQRKASECITDKTGGEAKQKAKDEEKISSAVAPKSPDTTTVPLSIPVVPQEPATRGVANGEAKTGGAENADVVRQAGKGTQGVGAGYETPMAPAALSNARAANSQATAPAAPSAAQAAVSPLSSTAASSDVQEPTSQSGVSESSDQPAGVTPGSAAQTTAGTMLPGQSAPDGAARVSIELAGQSKAEPGPTPDADTKSSVSLGAALALEVLPRLEPAVALHEKTDSKPGSTGKKDAAKQVENRSSQPKAGAATEQGTAQKETAAAGDKAHSTETNSTVRQPEIVVPSAEHQPDGSASVLAEAKASVTSAEISDGKNAPGNNATMGASVSAHADTAQVADGRTIVNSANLVERLGQSELRVGIQTAELGSIDIRTRLSHHELMAEIAVQRSDLGTALTASISNLHARLAEQHLAVGEIVVQNQPFGTSTGMQQGTGQTPNQPQGSFTRGDLKEDRSADSSDVCCDASDQGHGLDLHI